MKTLLFLALPFIASAQMQLPDPGALILRGSEGIAAQRQAERELALQQQVVAVQVQYMQAQAEYVRVMTAAMQQNADLKAKLAVLESAIKACPVTSAPASNPQR